MTLNEEAIPEVPSLNDYFEELDESDEEPPATAQVHLDWRLDPAISHSDWTIEIATNDEDQKPKVVEYHVHKAILTVGARKSGYFERICREDAEFQECATHSSRIELEKIAADTFPAMLDYLYQKNSLVQFRIGTQSATALHFLGQYLDIRALRWEALQFIKKDMSLSNCHDYYSHACILNNKKILGIAVELCAKQFCNTGAAKHPIVAIADFQFWIEVLKKYEGKPAASRHASCLVEKICKEREPDLLTFKQLTSEVAMPDIDEGAALGLLAVEANLVDYGELSELTTLQERCIRVLSRCHQQLLDDEDVARALAKQGPLFLASILTKALAVSKTQLDTKNSQLATANSQLATANSQLVTKNSEIAQKNRVIETQLHDIASLNTDCATKRQKLSKLQTRINEIHEICTKTPTISMYSYTPDYASHRDNIIKQVKALEEESRAMGV